MEATTTTETIILNPISDEIDCPNCNDRGVIWTEIFPGAWKNHLCDCHTPEYWATESDRTLANFMERSAAAKQRFGGGISGEAQNAG